MWGNQSTIPSNTPTPRMTNRRLVDVGMFVRRYINAAFNALQEREFMNSNSYDLLYTLLRNSTITSEVFQAIQGRLFDVIPQGTTNISDVFPIIYYRMFQRLLRNISDLTIEDLLEYKEAWLRNPSYFVNEILGDIGARRLIAQGADAQNNAISKACKSIKSSAKSAGGAGQECSTRVIFKGASFEQQNRCCICGLGSPPPLTDIEHVVSSQLLISLGICPATRSFRGFQDIFNDLRGASSTNWVETIVNYFPFNSQTRARRAFRSIMLPAHEYCNRVIKSEWSPFYVDEEGNIRADINEDFKDMGQTYAERVIIPSIQHVNEPRTKRGTPRKLDGRELQEYITEWITEQQATFSEIAWLLNSIEQRNNNASWFLFNYLYEVARDGDSSSDRAAFAELVTNILGYDEIIRWEEIESVLSNNQNKLKIKTILTLLVQAILVLFQADIQVPTQEATPMNISGSDTEHSGSDTEYSGSDTGNSGNDADNEYSSQGFASVNSSIDDTISDSSYTTESELTLSGSDLESDTSNSKSQSSNISLRERAGSNKRKSPTKQLGRTGRQLTRAILINEPIIEAQVESAVNHHYSGSTISDIARARAMMVARNAARAAVNVAPDDANLKVVAYNAAKAALIYYDNGNYSSGLGGGLRNRMTRKYTTMRRHATRKRRAGKKPRRTIRRRRAPRRTQTRRK
jgi:hypothetical protein